MKKFSLLIFAIFIASTAFSQSITITTPVEGDDIVNAAEATTVTVTGTSGGGTDLGEDVDVTIGTVTVGTTMDGNNSTWTAVLDISGETEGPLTVQVVYDPDGSDGGPINATNYDHPITLDISAPAITADPTVSPNTGGVGVGDNVVVTLVETGGETGLSASGTATINSVDVSGSFSDIGGGSYTYTYTISESDTDWSSGALAINLGLLDAAGNESTTTTLTTNSLIGDGNTPAITANPVVSPDGVTSNVGDVVTVTLTETSNETGLVASGTATINGVDVSGDFTDNGDGTYDYDYTISNGDSDWSSGALTINLGFQDVGGNEATTTTLTANTSVGDANSPDITGVAVSPSTGTSNVGDAITVTLTDDNSEAGFDNGSTVEINGVDVSASFTDNADGTYTYTYTVAEGNADWTASNLPINIQIQDDALNVTTVTAFTDGNDLAGDANTPVITANPVVSPDGVTSNVGDVVTVTLTETSNETGLVASGTATINGVDVSGDFTDNGDGTYDYDYTITEGDSDWSSGALTINLGFQDAAGNEATTTTLTANTSVGDANSPDITGVAVSPDGVTSNVGDAITVTLTDDNSEAGFDNGSTVEINGVDVSASFTDNADGTYTYTYTVTEGNADWTAGNLPINIEIQDDALNVTTITAFTDGNTLAGDANSPDITGVAVSPSTGTSNVGDAITVTLTDDNSEAGFDNGSTVEINGVDVSASFTDNADGTYTYTYTVVEGNADWTASNLPINIQIQDDALNVTAVTAFTDGNDLAGDANTPVITANPVVSPDGVTSNVGDVVTVTLTETSNETGLVASGTATINGVDVSGDFTDNGDGTYDYDYTITEGDSDWSSGALTINLGFQDAAGNEATTTTLTANTSVGDANSPDITGVAVSPSTGTSNVGDAITVTLTDDNSEAGFDNGSTVEINGVDVSASFTDNADGTYTYTYTVAEGNADWTASNLPINIQIQDDALNVTTVTAFTDGNDLVGDANTPVITANPVVSPDGVTSNVGDVVTVTLTETSNETGLVASGTATINGVDVSGDFTDNGDGTYDYDYTITEGDSDWSSGALTINLGFQDAAGNEATTTTLTANTSVGDANSPDITGVAVSPSTGTSNVGDAITVTLTDDNSEAGFDNGSTVEINGVDVSASFTDNADGTYTYTYTVAEGNADWTASNLPINIQIQDDALNVTTVTAFTDGNDLAGDANTPVITANPVVSPDGVTSNVGDVVTVTLTETSNETGLVASGTATINGVDVSGDFTDNGDGTYDYDYTITEGDSDWSSGALTINLGFQDAAGNEATTTTLTANTSVGDANTPVITANPVVSPDGVTSNVGDVVTVTLTETSNETGLLASGTATINGVDVSGDFTDNGDGTYDYDYTITEGDSDWSSGALTINLGFQDAAGNEATTTTLTANTSVGDANSPDITGVAVSPSTGTSNVGDAITVTLTDDNSEAGFDNGSTVEINGVDVSASFTDNADGTYTYTYTVAEGNADWTAGNLPINIEIQDDALNVTTITAFTDGNDLAGDANTPVITANPVVSPDGVTSNVGDVVTVTLTETSNETGLVASGTATINGVDVSGDFTDNGDGTYDYDYTITEGDSDWSSGALTINLGFQDAAGNEATTTTLTANTSVGDANSPDITGVAVSPDGVTSNVGDAITVTLTDDNSEAGFDNGSTVEINGVDVSASFTDNADGTYTYTYTVTEGNADWTAGNLPINIEIQDDALNVTTITAFTDGNTLAGDANSPDITGVAVSPSTGTSNVGDAITVTLTDDNSEAGFDNGSTVEINGVDVSASFTDNADGTYTYTYTVAEGNADWTAGNLPINIEIQDDALNVTTITAFTDGNTLAGDANSPDITGVAVSPDGVTSNVGDAITVTLTDDNSEAGFDNGSTVEINGVDVSASFTDNADGTYTYTYTVAEGNADWTAGNLPINIQIQDDALNVTTVTAFTDGNTLAGDANSPDITGVAVSPDGVTSNVGDAITVTLTDDNSEAGFDNGSTVEINGVDVSASFTDNADGTYTYTYTVAEGNADWTAGNLPINIEIQDDALNVTTITAFTDGNTLAGDANTPVITANPVVSPDGVTSNVGDVVTVTLTETSNETGLLASGTATINGVDVSGDFTDNGDGTYDYDYTITEGDSDWSSGALTINLGFQDAAGNEATTTTLTANTSVGDANSPDITGVAVSPSTGTSNVGDAITVTLTDDNSEAGFDNGSTVEINGVDVSASFTDNADGTYTYTYTVAEGNADWTAGNLPINIEIQDDALNVTTITAFTDGNTLAGDANSPDITGVAVSPDGVTSNVGDAITVTLTDDNSEAGFDNGSTVEINGVDVSASFTDNADGTYTYTYTVAEGNADWTAGNLPINIQIQDDALNVTTVTAFTDGNTLAGDANSPDITGVAVSPDGVTSNVGDAITVTLTDDNSEAGFDNGSTVEINGVDVSASFTDNADGTYTYTYTVAEGNADWTAGNLPINIQIQDDALNVTTVTAFTDGNTLAGDANSPDITGVAVSPDGVTSNVGDAITVTLTDDNSEAGFDNGSTVEINGVDVSASFTDNADGTYTYTYTVAEGNADWTAGNLPINIEIQDDALNVTTITAFTDSNTLAGDANSPDITGVTVSPNSGTADVGDAITVTLTDDNSEAGFDNGSTVEINGVDVSASFTDNADGTYTYTYTVAEGNADWLAGNLPINVEIQDDALNVTTITAFTDGNTLAGDANSPNITGVAVSPSTGTANVGDVITVTLTDGLGEAGFTNGSTVEINSVDVSASFTDNGDGTYTYTYTVAEGDADWTASNLPIDIDIQDASLNVTTVTAFNDGNTLAGDANSPSVLDVSVDDALITDADVSNTFNVTITFDEAMNTSATPVVQFSATVTGTLTLGTGSWTVGNTVYTAPYTVGDGEQEDADITIDVISAQDAALNPQFDYTPEIEFSIDNENPIVTQAAISITSAGIGTSGEYIIGNTVDAQWDNSGTGDNNADVITSVTIDFSAFEGSATETATATSDIWEASITLVDGTTDLTNQNISITATDDAGNTTTLTDNQNVSIDIYRPVVNQAEITILTDGSGTSNIFVLNDDVTTEWDNSALNAGNNDIVSVEFDYTAFEGGQLDDTDIDADDVFETTYTIALGAVDANNLNVGVIATDDAGNTNAQVFGTDNESLDNIFPTVTAANITINSGTDIGSGVSGEFILGTLLGTPDDVDVEWDNTNATGDDNGDIVGVTVDYTEFEGAAAEVASESSDVWSATHTMAAGSLDGDTDINVFISVTDDAGNVTTIEDDAGVTVDNVRPAAPSVPDLIASDDTGTDDTDDITGVDQPTFEGSGAVAGEPVWLWTDQPATNTAIEIDDDVLSSGGNYSFDLASADIGFTLQNNTTHNIEATAFDAAGNESARSTALVYRHVSPPVFTDSDWLDSDANGSIDQLQITIDRDVDLIDNSAGGSVFDAITFNVGVAFNASVDQDASGVTVITLEIDESTAVGTGDRTDVITYDDTNASGSVIRTIAADGGIEMLNGETDDPDDSARPVVIDSRTLDDNSDGNVETVELQVSENISDSEFTGEEGNFTLTPPSDPTWDGPDAMDTFDDAVATLSGGDVDDDDYFSFTFTPGGTNGTGVFTLEYDDTTGDILDAAGNELSIPGGTVLIDGAIPRVNNTSTDLTPGDGDTGVSSGTTLTMQYSEHVTWLNPSTNQMVFAQVSPPLNTIYSDVSNFANIDDNNTDGTVTITIPYVTEVNTDYYMYIPDGTFVDESTLNNVSAAQFQNATGWNFQTATALVVVGTSHDGGTTVTLQFNADPTITSEVPGDFEVRDGIGTMYTVDDIVDPGGNFLELVMDAGTPFTNAAGDLFVDYTDNGTMDITAGVGQLQNFTDEEVDFDTTNPLFTAATRDSDTQITLEYANNEPVQITGAGTGDFSVADGKGDTYDVTAVTDGTADDEFIVLTTDPGLLTAPGDITVTYTDNSDGISDFGNNPQENDQVVIELDSGSPNLEDATVNGTTEIILDFDEDVQILDDSPADEWTVTDGGGNGFDVSVISDAADDDLIELKVSDLTNALGDLTINYFPVGTQISDYGSNDYNTNPDFLIDRDNTDPMIASAVKVSSTEIDVYFDEPVQINSTGGGNDFVIADEAGNTFNQTAVDDNTAQDEIVRLTYSDNLDDAIGDIIVTYDNSDSEVEDFGGNFAVGGTVTIDLDLTVVPSYVESFLIPYDNLSLTFTAGETVNIGTTPQTATVISDSGTELIVSGLTGTVVDGETIAGQTSGATADVNSTEDIFLSDDTEGDMALFRSTSDPSANVPLTITPSITGSTITFYRTSDLSDDVSTATYTGVNPSVSPTVAEIMGEDITTWGGIDDNGVYTFYFTETAQNGTTSESPEVEFSLAFMDNVVNSVGGQSFGQSDETGTTLSVTHPNGQTMLWGGDGLSSIDYNEGTTSTADFIPSAAGQGTKQVSIRWESQTSGISATFNPAELLFNVTASSDVLFAATPLAYDKTEGTAIIGINNILEGIDVGEDQAGDGDDVDKSDFYGIEAYYIVNGAPQTGVGGADIFGDANSVYNGGTTDANIAASVMTFTGAAFVSGQPTDALDAWQFDPMAFVDNIIDNGQAVDTVRLVSISQADGGGSRAVIEEVDIYLYPAPDVTIEGVNATYCEDEDQFIIQAAVFTYTGTDGVDSTGFITNGYVLNESTDSGATYNFHSDSTATGSSGEINTIDPSLLGPGLYQIQYTSEEQTAANTTSTVTFEFEVITVDSAPSLDITNFDDNGGFDGSRYVFEYCSGDAIPNLEIDRTASNSAADNTNNSYSWYESDGTPINDGDANTYELLITSLFNTNTPTNDQEVDLYVTRTLNTCESDSIPIVIRVHAIPEIPEMDFSDNDIFQDRDDYYFEYCSDVFTSYDNGTIVTILEDPDDRVHVSNRSYFEVLDASKSPIDSIFYDAGVDATGYTIDFSTEPYASLVSTTPDGSPSGIVTQNFFLVKRVADSAYNTDESTQQWAGCNGDTAQFITRIYTVPDVPDFDEFTGNPHNIAGDGSVVQYYMCRTDDVLPLDVGINVPANTPNFIYEWFTYNSGTDTYTSIDVTDREGERLSLDDLVAAGFDEDVTSESDYTYYVRLRSNVNEDSGFGGCTTALDVASGLREVRIKVLPDVVEPQISLGTAPEAEGAPVTSDIGNFDIEFNFCVVAGTGLDAGTELVADVQYSSTREVEILEWFNANADGNAIVGTSIVSTTDTENHTVTAEDLRIQGSENQTFNFAVLYNTDRVEDPGVIFSGCTSIDTAFVRLNVSTIPDAQFNFSGITAGETTSFWLFDNNASRTADGGVTFEILDSDSNQEALFTLDTLNETNAPLQVSLSDPGDYTATLTVGTEAGCSNTITRTFRVLEKIVVTQSHQENFETDNGGWFAEFQVADQNDQTSGSINVPVRGSSWEYGNPDGSVIDETFVAGGSAWATTGTVDATRPNSYVGGEVSYIYSPAFDISALSNPAIEFLTYRDFDGIRDGVVFQYSTDDGVTWSTLGDFDASNVVPSSGQNWYNESGISTAPGEGTVLNPVGGFNARRVGWADRPNDDSERGWVLSSHALDITTGLDNVRFRFALSASGTSTDEKSGNGFAFDDLNIFQLGKTVIVEQFSSSVNDNSIAVNNTITASNGATNDPIIDLDDVMLLNYFTRLSNAPNNIDEINARNRNDPGARAAYYNVESVPNSAVDGTILTQSNPDELSWNLNDINVGKLASAGFDFPTITSTSTDPGIVAVTARFQALEDIDDADLSFIFAVVERTVTVGEGGLGNYTEGQTIDNVVRILLPGPAGFNYIGNVSSDAGNVDENIFEYSVEWVIDNVYDASQLRVIVFAQNNDTKEILQSGYLNIVGATQSILGLEAEREFEIYPIPGDEEISVRFREPVVEGTYWTVFDQAGGEVLKGVIDKGTDLITIETKDVPSGVYFINIYNDENHRRVSRIFISH